MVMSLGQVKYSISVSEQTDAHLALDYPQGESILT